MMGIALTWSLTAIMMKGGEATYGEMSLVGARVSGVELLFHCSAASVDSQSKPIGGGEGSHCAVLLLTFKRALHRVP